MTSQLCPWHGATLHGVIAVTRMMCIVTQPAIKCVVACAGNGRRPAFLRTVWLPSARLGAMPQDCAETADGRSPDGRGGGTAVALRSCCLCGCRLRNSARCLRIAPRRRTAGAQTAGAGELLLACAPAVCVAAVCETRRSAAGSRRDGGRQEPRPQARGNCRRPVSLLSAAAAVQSPLGARRAATGRRCQARRSAWPRWLRH